MNKAISWLCDIQSGLTDMGAEDREKRAIAFGLVNILTSQIKTKSIVAKL